MYFKICTGFLKTSSIESEWLHIPIRKEKNHFSSYAWKNTSDDSHRLKNSCWKKKKKKDKTILSAKPQAKESNHPNILFLTSRVTHIFNRQTPKCFSSLHSMRSSS